MERFKGKNILVTGGTSGIGRAAAQAYAREGATVVVTGRDPAALDSVKDWLGPNGIGIRNDVAEAGSPRALAEQLQAAGLQLDGAFLNAGVARFSDLASTTEAFWDQLFNTNVKSVYFQLQALAPLFRKGAAVVLNGSVNAHIGMPGSAVYGASKAALVSLARTLSAELLPRGVRVNVVSPGPVQTPLYGKLGFDAQTLEATAENIRAQVPLGRFGDPAEIASTVLHLTAAESAFLVGTEIIADGGMINL